MNLITFRVPNKIYINDASEHGLGGFATHGRAWTYNIPEKLRGRAHINLLEFLAQLISIWIDVLEHKIHPLVCLLGMGDNTASMGWLRRSNFRENDENDQEWLAKQKVARKLATLVLDSNASIYRQWFPGVENVVFRGRAERQNAKRRRSGGRTHPSPPSYPSLGRPLGKGDSIIPY